MSAKFLEIGAFQGGQTLGFVVSGVALGSYSVIISGPSGPLASVPVTVTSSGPAVSITGFNADSAQDMGQCYAVTLTLNNNSSSTQSGQVSIGESASYFTVDEQVDPSSQTTFLGAEHPASKPPSNDNAGACNGPGLTQSVSIGPNQTQAVTFRVSHHWDWIPQPGVQDVAALVLSTLDPVVLKGILGKLLAGGIDGSHAGAQIFGNMHPVLRAKYQYAPLMTGLLQGATVASGVAPSKTVTITVSSLKQDAFSGSLALSVVGLVLDFSGVGWVPGLVVGAGSFAANVIAYDPNPSYTQPVVAQPVHITQLDSLPAGQAHDCGQQVEQFISNVMAAQAAGTEAEGAAEAGDSTWYATQLSAANGFLNSATSQQSAITGCVSQLPAGSPAAGGLSPDLQSALTQIGVPTQGIQSLVQAASQAAPNVTPSASAATTALQQAFSSLQNVAVVLQPSPPSPSAGSVTYAAGWNLVGGPTGMTLTGTAASLYTFQASDKNYETVGSNVLTAPQGYWAYFPTSNTVKVPQVAGQTTSINLPANHFVMIGDPFDVPVTLSGADIVYAYSPSGGYS